MTQPLAKALLEARVPCPKAVEQLFGPQHDAVTAGQFRRDHQGCSLCGGTGKVWPEPLRWLAEQVLKPCVACRNHSSGHPAFFDSGCRGTGWVPKDSTDWPKGWAFGLARLWLVYCWRTLPNIPGWLTLLVERLSDLIDKAEDRWHESPEVDTLSLDALVEAVSGSCRG